MVGCVKLKAADGGGGGGAVLLGRSADWMRAEGDGAGMGTEGRRTLAGRSAAAAVVMVVVMVMVMMAALGLSRTWVETREAAERGADEVFVPAASFSGDEDASDADEGATLTSDGDETPINNATATRAPTRGWWSALVENEDIFEIVRPRCAVCLHPPVKVIMTRGGGRSGNLLFEHVFWRLVALHRSKPFLDTSEPDAFDTGCFELVRQVPKPTPARIPAEALGWTEGRFAHEGIPDWPHDFRYYRRNRDLIRNQILRFKPFPTNVSRSAYDYDVVVHVRMDDVLHVEAGLGYALMPFSFYKSAFRRIPTSRATRVAVVSHVQPTFGYDVLEQENVVQRQYLEDLVSRIRGWTSASTVSLFTDSSVEHDHWLLSRAKVVVASPSTYWVWPVFLSASNVAVHVPLYGKVLEFQFWNDLDAPGMDGGDEAGGEGDALRWVKLRTVPLPLPSPSPSRTATSPTPTRFRFHVVGHAVPTMDGVNATTMQSARELLYDA